MPRSLKRPNSTRQLNRKILIVCEGKETEPGYFDAIRIDLRFPAEIVSVFGQRQTGVTDPLGIVDFAVEKRQELRQEKRWSQGDSAWAVFDGDEHREQNYQNWQRAIAKACNQQIHLAITNPCFEFWYLIHFQDHFAQIDRDKVRTELKKHIPKL